MPIETASTLADRIDAWLPQTQCTRCGYPRCREYAQAIAEGRADINRCPPGGDVTLRGLAELLHVDRKPLDPACGAHEPRTRAVIDEAICIGCRKCLDVCPVDAIHGARKLMHTVIAQECNGCGLCVPPCPVDCILITPVSASGGERWPEYTSAETERWRVRTENRVARLAQRAARREASRTTRNVDSDRARIRAEILASVERVRAKRTQK